MAAFRSFPCDVSPIIYYQRQVLPLTYYLLRESLLTIHTADHSLSQRKQKDLHQIQKRSVLHFDIRWCTTCFPHVSATWNNCRKTRLDSITRAAGHACVNYNIRYSNNSNRPPRTKTIASNGSRLSKNTDGPTTSTTCQSKPCSTPLTQLLLPFNCSSLDPISGDVRGVVCWPAALIPSHCADEIW